MGVAVKERELVELRADRTLDSAHGVGVEQRLHVFDCPQKVLSELREPLAESRQLRDYVVRACRENLAFVRIRLLRQKVQGGDRLCADDFQRLVALQLLDAFGEVAACHTLVNVLEARELAEFLDARLDVVARDFLALVYFVYAYVVFDAFVGVDCLLRNVEPELLLSFHNGNPQVAFEEDFSLRAPVILHRLRGVSFCQNVWYHN